MRYVYMVTDEFGSWPILREAPELTPWVGDLPSVEVDLLAKLPDKLAERLFYDLAALAFDRSREPLPTPLRPRPRQPAAQPSEP